MACALCGSNDDGEGGLCVKCATLPSSFTETLDEEGGPGAPLAPPVANPMPPATPRPEDDPTRPLLEEPLPLPLPLPLPPLARVTGLTFGPGEAFGERYTIVEEVGAGGMGQVYKALDRRLGRAVALKLIRPDHAARAEARERFQRELLLAQQVTHPNVCRVHDLGEVRGIRYISMEYIEGQTLEDLIHSVGHLSPKQTVALGKQVCAGLEAIHERGIVHRDLKPGNIMIDRAGHALLMDFGMAYRPGGERLTAEGAVLGTLAYLSPEHARGARTDARSDLYALGLILFEMLTGRRPPGDENLLPLAVRDVSEPCPPPSRLVPEVPAPLDDVVLRCVDRDPDKRYGSARDLEQALTEVGLLLTSYSTTLVPSAAPRSPTTTPRIAPPAPRRPWAWLAAGALLLAAVLAIWPRLFPPKPGIASVALVVFDYEGPEANRFLQELLPAVVGEALRTVPEVQVAPFASARSFGPTDSPAAVAEALGVDHVVTGSVRVAGGQVESLLKMYGRDGTELGRFGPRAAPVGSGSETGGRLAAEIARALGKAPPLGRVRNPQAIDAYVEGRRLLEGWDMERNYERAEAAFRRAVEIDGSFAEARANLALALCSNFQETRAPRLIEEAGREARLAVDQAPELPEAWLALGVVQVVRGQSAEATTSLLRAQQLGPGDDSAARLVAQAYQRQGRFDEAERFYERAIELRPQFWDNHNSLGRFFLARGDYARARESFRRVTELRPRSDVGYINLAQAYLWEGELEKAEPLLLEALKLGQRFQPHNNLAYVYYNTGRFEEAARSYRAALDVGGAQMEVYGGLGDALRQLNRPEEARAAYDRARELARERLRVDPDDAEVRSGLAMFLAGSGRCGDARREASLVLQNPSAPVGAHSYLTVAFAICRDDARALEQGLAAIAGGALSDLRTNPDLRKLRENASFRERLAAAATPRAAS